VQADARSSRVPRPVPGAAAGIAAGAAARRRGRWWQRAARLDRKRVHRIDSGAACIADDGQRRPCALAEDVRRVRAYCS